MFDVELANRIRTKAAAWNLPLDVIEIDGWRERGRGWSSRPSLSLGHHTANRNTGWAPSLGICINGRGEPGDTDYLPGPLCQALRARKREGRYTVFVIAAGIANHAGKGGYAGRVGNSMCMGLEVENVGTSAEPWTDEDQEIDALILAAMVEGAPGSRTACEHKEWAPTRKVDRHTIHGDTTRNLVAKYLGPAPQPEPAPEDQHVITIYIPTDDAGNTHDGPGGNTGNPLGPQIVDHGDWWSLALSDAEHEALKDAGARVEHAKPFVVELLFRSGRTEYKPR